MTLTVPTRVVGTNSDPEPGVYPYNPDLINETYGHRYGLLIGRFLQIALPLVAFYLGLVIDRLTRRDRQAQRAQAFRKLLTGLGPAAIKVGQALSTRPDLVPPAYLEELAQLQDQLPPFPNPVAYQFIEEELGLPPEKVFAELSPQPIAAASLGQVYRGRLHSGEAVAVKVQRPGLIEQISLDLCIIRRLVAWGKRLMGKRIRSNLVAILDEFGYRLFEEMDYRQEGRNAEQFAALYGHLPQVYVPRIYWAYTRRRVLTMEWIQGVKLTDLDRMAAFGLNGRDMVAVGVQCSLRQLLEHGFFHADPHPGNLLAMPDGKLAYLDFGMMSHVTPTQRYGLLTAIVHMVNRDYEALAYDYVALDFLSTDTDLTPIKLALANVFSDILGPAGALGASVAQLNIKRITDKLSALMYEYPFQVPAYYALIIRSLVTLEGLAITIDPSFKVLSVAYPYVAKRLLVDNAPELRQSLRDLLFKDGTFRWSRLENLVRNAVRSDDFDLEVVLAQITDFLLSERGEFIRNQLAEELARSLDTWGQSWLGRLWPKGRPAASAPAQETSVNGAGTVHQLTTIWQIVQESPDFDPVLVFPLLGQVVFRPETREFGQHLSNRLSQRVLSRVIRQLLLPERGSGGTLAPS
ncbi:MAG: AarF/ABC1/UbiB kinase family protein [Gloeomargaritaceae cyanobacterium C42_A2020_066]|nr:AarF/ABC1/UbiB kinase family protein [Gloeomargaritaceae cyanobacterium C42_A2020_066]